MTATVSGLEPGETGEGKDEGGSHHPPPSPHSLHHGRNGGGEVNMAYHADSEPRRRVSIASDAIQADMERSVGQRKISTTSSQHEGGTGGSGRLKAGMANGGGGDGKDGPVLPHNLDNVRKPSCMYESIDMEPEAQNSWWYLWCTKCRQKESGPGWEPPFWQSICPYPFCPTYRHIARIISLFALGLLAWGIVYSIIGKDIAPGGQLFQITAVCILAHFGGWLFRMINLPGLVGMLLVGIIYQNVGLIHVTGHYLELIAILRKIALVMILIRAGLDLEPDAMKRLCFTVLRMGLVPWIVEFFLLVFLSHKFLGLPWLWGILLASIVSAVAPAVVVPCLIRLRNKGYGVAKGVPTLIIAVSGIDDAAAVTTYGIIYGIIFSANSLTHDLIIGPISVIVGIGFGSIWGLFCTYLPEKEDPFVVPLRILTLLGGCMIAVFGSEVIGMEGAGPLGVISAAFVSICFWSKQGWEIESNPVANAFEIFWMLCEPVLFALTGTQVKFAEIDPSIIGIGVLVLSIGIVTRIAVTVIVGVGSSLNTKEKFFVAISWMAKATVQAALGPVAVNTLRDKKDTEDYKHAEVVMMICILSILLTAPLGAILITLTGSTLLKKTTGTVSPPEGWRRSHRPSMRDITIIDEADEGEDENENDLDKRKKKELDHAGNWRQQQPPIVITSQP